MTDEQPANLTPCYVLLGRDGPLSLPVMQFFTGPKIAAVFGFSSKACYERFIDKATNNLRPYPLTSQALTDQLELQDDIVRIVVLDARSPDEPSLNAASIVSVLKAKNEQRNETEIGFRLVHTMFSNEYRVEKII
jgi:hypothetical protein